MTEPSEQLPPIDFGNVGHLLEASEPATAPPPPWYRHPMLWVAAGSALAVALVVAFFVDPFGTTSFPVKAKTSCTITSGVFVVSESNGEAVVAAEDVKANLRSGGRLSSMTWCLGAVHEYEGTVDVPLADGSYEFRSNRSRPLRFEVTDGGYEYRSGKGTVVTPDGDVVRFGGAV